jgi:lipopolysaccharide/colanic/teichoic acid biosynthesis glycosyltransferase
MRSENNVTPAADFSVDSIPAGDRIPLDEQAFKRMIAIERKRTERSETPFLLMLLELTAGDNPQRDKRALDIIVSALMATSRDTDIVGWYQDQVLIGEVFTGVVGDDRHSIATMIGNRVSATLREELAVEQFEQVRLSFHFFPDDWDHDKPGRLNNPALYPDLVNHKKGKRPLLLVKRMIDILGSALMLILCAPVFLAIAAAVKLTSAGPVFFRQKRVGQYGRSFTFLKFRSMYVNNDHTVHKEFVTQLIANRSGSEPLNGNDKGVYKLTNDKRVTSIGKILRRTSLDELPQFLNVVWGDMSLVGPRPPIPYELAAYQTWHRRRLLDVKPGITGLWQVMGRSRVKFDEMVRLDLRYATSWTPWLDLRILLMTPIAVIRGSGAY